MALFLCTGCTVFRKEPWMAVRLFCVAEKHYFYRRVAEMQRKNLFCYKDIKTNKAFLCVSAVNKLFKKLDDAS